MVNSMQISNYKKSSDWPMTPVGGCNNGFTYEAVSNPAIGVATTPDSDLMVITLPIQQLPRNDHGA